MDTQPTWDWSAVGGAEPSPQADMFGERRRRPYAAASPDEAPSSSHEQPTPTQPIPEGAASQESPPADQGQGAASQERPATDRGPGSASQQKPPTGRGHGPVPKPVRRNYGPRSCRICLDTEYPQYAETTTTFGIASGSSRPKYVSEDPELGRLLSPCKCKGSQKYVHEGCLNSWRLANPTAARNYWQCPTCGFTYRLARLQWASLLSSKVTQVILTLAILFLSVFALGFVADPIMDLWIDPFGTITETVSSVVSDIEAVEEIRPAEPTSWPEHFAKGFFSLGLVGFLKSALAMGPWQWWNLRMSGALGTGRRQGTGRGRMDSMSMALVLIGVFSFLMAIWKVVKALSERVLKRVSDSVMDVGGGEDEDEDVDAATADAGPDRRND